MSSVPSSYRTGLPANSRHENFACRREPDSTSIYRRMRLHEKERVRQNADDSRMGKIIIIGGVAVGTIAAATWYFWSPIAGTVTSILGVGGGTAATIAKEALSPNDSSRNQGSRRRDYHDTEFDSDSEEEGLIPRGLRQADFQERSFNSSGNRARDRSRQFLNNISPDLMGRGSSWGRRNLRHRALQPSMGPQLALYRNGGPGSESGETGSCSGPSTITSVGNNPNGGWIPIWKLKKLKSSLEKVIVHLRWSLGLAPVMFAVRRVVDVDLGIFKNDKNAMRRFFKLIHKIYKIERAVKDVQELIDEGRPVRAEYLKQILERNLGEKLAKRIVKILLEKI